MKIIIASNNKGKINEFKKLFSDFNIEILSLADLSLNVEVEETGTTFLENAIIKARVIYEKTSLPVIADDSGLEVDFLNGAPSVYSSRFAGENATDEENNILLLKKLSGIKNRKARFVCVIVFYDDNEVKLVCKGFCEGEIAKTFFGKNGFGYDPLFLYNGKSFSQMTLEEKNKISHRAMAFSDLKNKIFEFLK